MTRGSSNHRRGRTLGLVAVGVLVGVGGASYSVTTNQFVGDDGLVTACVKGKKGKVRLLAEGRECRKKEDVVTWNQVGPPGQPGEPGEPGPPGSIQGAPAGGDLEGTYPAPRIAPAAAPVDVADNPLEVDDPCFLPEATTMVLCGTPARHWQNGGFGAPGVQVWRDRFGDVRIRGSATVSSGPGTGTIFVLPADHRPKRILTFPLLTGETAGSHPSGIALLVIYPDDSGGSDGHVAVFSPSDANDRVVHFGELAFRVDA